MARGGAGVKPGRPFLRRTGAAPVGPRAIDAGVARRDPDRCETAEVSYARRMNARALACIAIAAALTAGAAAAQDWRTQRPAPAEGQRYPECFCTNRGERVEIGERACLRVDGRQFTALCFMSQNSPGWRREREGCAPQADS
jgi:hypothetical protein